MRCGSAAVLGVEPQLQSKYMMETFHCLDGSGTAVPASSVNDDFCDCLDGSDEPGTGACSGQDKTLFYCANEGSSPKMLYASRVGDGVCDCCDGTDEAVLARRHPAARCANFCAEQGLVEKKERDIRIEKLKLGVSKKEAVKAAAIQDRDQWRNELEKLKGQLPELEKVLSEAKAAADVERAAAAAEAANLTGAAAACMWRQTGGCSPTGEREPSNDKLCNVVIPAGSSGFCDCDGDGRQGAGEPGYDCSSSPPGKCYEACKTAGLLEPSPTNKATVEDASEVQSFKAADGSEDKAQVSEYAKWMDGAASVLGSEAQGASETNQEKPQVSEYTKWMDNAESIVQPKHEQADSTTQGPSDGSTVGEQVSQKDDTVATSALDAEKVAQKNVDDLMRRQEELESKLATVSEEHMGYASLSGKTLSRRVSEWDFKIEFFGEAKQDYTSLGRWSKWTGPHMGVFENGQTCWEGPARSLTVKFQCGEQQELLDVFEPSRCLYEATLTHPGACDPEELRSLLNGVSVIRPKDEL